MEKSGIREFRFSAGEKALLLYCLYPLGMNDWMISYIVPVRAAEASYDFIRDYEIILSLSLNGDKQPWSFLCL